MAKIDLTMYRNVKNLSRFEKNILKSVMNTDGNTNGYPHISTENGKAGHAGYNETCINCNPECYKFFKKLGIRCYAQEGNYNFTNVFTGIARNTKSYIEDPRAWEKKMLNECRKYNTFRFFFTGDLLCYEQFEAVVRIAKASKRTDVYMFTKAYAYVNQFVEQNGLKAIPKNLTVIFSEIPGRGFNPNENPYHFGVAKIIDSYDMFMKIRTIGQDYFCYHKMTGCTCMDCRKCVTLAHGKTIYLPKL